VSQAHDANADLMTLAVAGTELQSDRYGADYVSEFRRVLREMVVRRTGNLLEWGAGFTTRVLVEYARETNANLLLTIDDKPDYLNDVIAPFGPLPFLRAEAIDLTGPRLSDRDPELNYSTFPLSLNKTFDVIFIDGRRRMECAFVAALLSHEDTTVVLHDYRRTRYQHVRALFEIVEDGPQFRVMKLRWPLTDHFASVSPIVGRAARRFAAAPPQHAPAAQGGGQRAVAPDVPPGRRATLLSRLRRYVG
jgi:hypothetical protein